MTDQEKKLDSDYQKSIILAVEDDKFLRELIVQKLEKEGFEAQSAVDAEEAFKKIAEKRPDLILLDLVLPGMDGFSVIKQLKKDQKTASIPVIILSNLGQKEDLEKAMNDGAADYLVKANFTPGEIIEKVRMVLRKGYI